MIHVIINLILCVGLCMLVSVCINHASRIEELEEDVEKLHINKVNEDLFVDVAHDFRVLEKQFYQDYRESVYLKILEIEAINSKVADKDLVVLEALKKRLIDFLPEDE